MQPGDTMALLGGWVLITYQEYALLCVLFLVKIKRIFAITEEVSLKDQSRYPWETFAYQMNHVKRRGMDTEYGTTYV